MLRALFLIAISATWVTSSLAAPSRFLSTGKYNFILHTHNNELGMIFPDQFQDWLWIVDREGNFSEVWRACEKFQGPNNEDFRLPTRTWVNNAKLGFLKEASFWISGCTSAGCNVVHVKDGKMTFSMANPAKDRFPIVCSSGANSRIRSAR